MCLGHGVFNEVASPYSTKQSRCHFGLALQKSNCVKRAARQQHQVHVRAHPLHKRIKCNGEEFDGYEIIVESVQPAPGSMWPPNVLVSKDGIESPWRYDFDTEYRKSDEATRAGVEIGRVFVRWYRPIPPLVRHLQCDAEEGLGLLRFAFPCRCADNVRTSLPATLPFPPKVPPRRAVIFPGQPSCLEC